MIAGVDSRGEIAESNADSSRPRIILCGASNLTRAFPLVVAELRRQRSCPIEIFSAHGNGRSYGLTSSILGRELPSILACGLWRTLETSRAAHSDALLTDIGNDIMY